MAYANPYGSAVSASTTSPPGGVPPAPSPGLTGDAWTKWYLNNNPQAGWVKYLQDNNLFGLDPTSKFAGSQYNKVYGQYTSAASQNPDLGFFDWINGAGSGVNLQTDFQNQSPSERGDFSGRLYAPRARMMRAY